MNGTRTRIEQLFEKIPDAIWSPGRPLPSVYRGKPIEMVEQMAHEMGLKNPNEAMDTLVEELARSGFRLCIRGNPPAPIRAGIFVYTLLQRGICRPMARA